MEWAVLTFIFASLITVSTLLVILWQITGRHDQIMKEKTCELLRIQDAARREAQAKAEIDLKVADAKWSTRSNGTAAHASK